MAVNPRIQLEIDAARTRFKINETGIRRYIGVHGPVGADLARRAVRVEASAKQHASGRPGPNVITGRLRGSITFRLSEDALGPYADIGSAVEYAPFVEARYPFLRPALRAAR